MGNLLRCAVVNLENNFSISANFTDVINNNYPRISSKMGLTIEDEALIVNNN
jgi:hypothetical protein